jgi:hypothetical protein
MLIMPTTKGSATSRGYGSRHKKLREQPAKQVSAGTAVCWRCGRPILPGMPFDLGHSDVTPGAYAGLEHNFCNRSSGARKGNRMRRVRRRRAKIIKTTVPTVLDRW